MLLSKTERLDKKQGEASRIASVSCRCSANPSPHLWDTKAEKDTPAPLTSSLGSLEEPEDTPRMHSRLFSGHAGGEMSGYTASEPR